MRIRVAVCRHSFGTGELAAELDSVIVTVDYSTGRPVRVPDDVRQAIATVEGLEFKADESEQTRITRRACALPSSLSLGFAACFATGKQRNHWPHRISSRPSANDSRPVDILSARDSHHNVPTAAMRSSRKYDILTTPRSEGDSTRLTQIKRAPTRRANRPSTRILSPITTSGRYR